MTRRHDEYRRILEWLLLVELDDMVALPVGECLDIFGCGDRYPVRMKKVVADAPALHRRPVDIEQALFHLDAVVGLPGDRIQVEEGLLYINGAPVQRRRIGDYLFHTDGVTIPATEYVETFPNGESHHIIEFDRRGHSRIRRYSSCRRVIISSWATTGRFCRQPCAEQRGRLCARRESGGPRRIHLFLDRRNEPRLGVLEVALRDTLWAPLHEHRLGEPARLRGSNAQCSTFPPGR